MSQEIYFISEIVATVAVIASLIFVGLQLRQNTSAVKTSNAQAMMKSRNELAISPVMKSLRKRRQPAVMGSGGWSGFSTRLVRIQLAVVTAENLAFV